MKIQNIIQHIDESLNTTAKDLGINLDWKNQGRTEITTFSFEGKTFYIQIYPTPIPQLPELKGKKIAEVSYYQLDRNQHPIHSSTGEFKKGQASKILGIVRNALIDKFNEYDALFFTAKERHEGYENQKSVYSLITSGLGKLLNAVVMSIPIHNGTLFLISKIGLSSENIKQLERY